jgi:hypothetical protein
MPPRDLECTPCRHPCRAENSDWPIPRPTGEHRRKDVVRQHRGQVQSPSFEQRPRQARLPDDP